MKILLVTQYFYPENFKGNDIAFELKKRGYEVTVLTGIPNYPKGEFYKGYGYFQKRREYINGVRIIRTFLIPRGKSSKIQLILNYFSWPIFATLYSIYLIFILKIDKIFIQQLSPITSAIPGIIIKKLTRKPLYIWILDLWPESLVAAGGVNNKIIIYSFEKLSKWIYFNSDKILISSNGFKKSILEKGVFDSKIEYFPNWAEESISNGKVNFNIPKLPDGFIIMFAGNVGEAQDMESILDASLRLKEVEYIKFIIVGDGRKMPYVKEFIEKNQLEKTVITIGRYPVDDMASFFNKSDLLLVSLKDDAIFNLTVPAKIQAYMSSGKPILAMLNGEGSDIVEEAECGFTVSASNSKQLAKTILEASKMKKEDLVLKGKNGKEFFDKNFTMKSCIDNLEEILNEN